jgi:hypothetical protein
MIDLLSDGGALLLLMLVAAVFAAMAWVGSHVN